MEQDEAVTVRGRPIHVDFRKWPDTLHWQFTMYHLADDEWGTWMWSPPGSTARRGTEEPKVFRHTNVKLIPVGAWWTAIWNDGFEFDLYVDIITPPVWDGDRVTMIDLDLDIERRLADGEVSIVDEDEFAERQVSLGYPDHVVREARRAADEVASLVASGVEPFSAAGAHWMQVAQRLG